MEQKSVLIGMSGGVDSSVAAALLKEQGYHVIGATMRLWTYSDSCNMKHEGCCAESAVEDARRVCDKLGIDFYVMNFKDMFKDKVVDYLRRLIEQGEYKHTIWPEHCLYGSEGAAITPVLMEALTCWAREGKYYEVVEKGLNPSTEFFGAFRANIPLAGAVDTEFNVKLKDELEMYDVIWLAGEAKSHCVANTLKQMFDYPEIIRRLVILEDCMSNISGCEDLAISIYEKAACMGARFVTSESLLYS